MKQRQFKLGCRESWTRMVGGFFALAIFSIGGVAEAWTLVPGGQVTLTPPANLQVIVQPPVLDAKRLFALGMIETGNNDGEVGAAGEVSRYQIHPAVWKTYSARVDYRNPDAAVEVARQHWTWLAGYFKEKAGRPPTDFDMYVLWNTRFGYYARKGFSRAKLAAVVQDRAERFVNLVNRKG